MLCSSAMECECRELTVSGALKSLSEFYRFGVISSEERMDFLLDNLRYLNFGDGRQHDSHEYLIAVLNDLCRIEHNMTSFEKSVRTPDKDTGSVTVYV